MSLLLPRRFAEIGAYATNRWYLIYCGRNAIRTQHASGKKMSAANIGFWIAVVGAGATVVTAIYGAIGYHFPKDRASNGRISGRRSRWLPAILFLISILGVGFYYYDRHTAARVSFVRDVGVNSPGIFREVVDTGPLMGDATIRKLMLIVRINDNNVDRMTDRSIVKSAAYTITGGPVTLVRLGVAGLKRVPSGIAEFEFDLASLPSQFSPDQVLSLSDVTRLGGQILETEIMQTDIEVQTH